MPTPRKGRPGHCRECDTTLTTDNTYASRQGRYICKTCDNARGRAWYRDNLQKAATSARIRKNQNRYGVSEEAYRSRLSAQRNACAICGETPRVGVNLDIDHCHTNGHFRGCLCRRCNILVGWLESTHAPAAIAYLNAWPSPAHLHGSEQGAGYGLTPWPAHLGPGEPVPSYTARTLEVF
jgi:hypothetical protein